MRRLILVASLLGAVLCVVVTAGPTFADGSGTVTATVSVIAGPCITVSPTSFAYAPQQFSTTTSLQTTTSTTKPTVTNCSDRSETFLARGEAATGPTTSWALANSVDCSVGTNIYAHALKVGGAGLYDFRLSETNTQWEQNVAHTSGQNTRTLDSQLTMPCTGSAGLGETRSTRIFRTALQ